MQRPKALKTMSQETCQHERSLKKFHNFVHSTREGVGAMNTVSTHVSLSVSSRLIVASVTLFLGLTMVAGIGFASDMAVHNGAHDTRHAIGFPCH